MHTLQYCIISIEIPQTKKERKKKNYTYKREFDKVIICLNSTLVDLAPGKKLQNINIELVIFCKKGTSTLFVITTVECLIEQIGSNAV